MKTQHTPAPWNIYEDGSGDVWHKPVITAWDEEDESSFDVAFPAHDLEHDEMVANARLIAEAPVLLELLQYSYDVLASIDFSEVPNHNYDSIRFSEIESTLLKATGDNK